MALAKKIHFQKESNKHNFDLRVYQSTGCLKNYVEETFSYIAWVKNLFL